MTRAVVFGYHSVGVRCLKVLLSQGIEIALVVTHDNAPGETIWFDSVAAVAAEHGVPAIRPVDPNAADIVSRVAAAVPDFIFSFYYRQMLKAPMLALASRGSLNMHGSLLPKYRGRVPVNWAIIHGETETGATLHYMTAKPDAGDIVAQTAVPILGDDTAGEVFNKVTVAAEMTLYRVLPALVAGNAQRIPQRPGSGSYFSGRKPEDGVIDWMDSAATIHNLVRAVAPPYPGSSTVIDGSPARILRTRVIDPAARAASPTLAIECERLVAHCGGGGTLAILTLEIAGRAVDPLALASRLPQALPLPSR
ncbi:MAG: formyltransferase [Casimicrobiaceae bacterium]